MQTTQTSKTSIIHHLLFGCATLLILNGSAAAQGDPFKKEPTAISQTTVASPLTANSYQEIADRARPGILGVAVYDFQTRTTQGVNLSRSFSLQSVFKIFLAATIFSQIDEGKLTLDQSITIAPREMLGGYGSIDKSNGGKFSIRDLVRAALIESDNTAADKLLSVVGGPQVVTAWLQGKGIDGIRIDRNLRTLGREESGIPADLSPNENASALEDRVSQEDRKAAFEKAMTDPRDTATPEGAIHFLVALKNGELLSPASNALFLSWLHEVQTGQGRLKAGFSSQTALAHKTGTSPEWAGIRLATNDIGLATLPDGRTLAIVVFLANAPGSDEDRDQILAACARLAARAN